MAPTPQAPFDAPTEAGDDSPTAIPRDGPLPPGTQVGRYRIEGILGRGGMGVVYEAMDPTLRRAVAIKFILSSGQGDRLRREAVAMARVAHPNVVTVIDVGEHEGESYIAMERIHGETLRTWLERSTPEPQEIEDVFRAAGAGLAALHDAGLVHRDFKPDNVMLAQGRVVVMDLGLATPDAADGRDNVSSPGDARRTRGGAVVGTPAYMSPEQFAGAVLDGRSDQFSFAVALYEALTGRRPFAGEHAAELAYALQTEDARPIPRGLSMSSGARRVLGRALAKDPALRFETMQALLETFGRRHRWGWFVIAGLVVATLVGVWGWGTRGPDCPDGRTVEGTWDGEARRSVEQAFEGFEAEYQRERRDVVLGRVDRYAARWADEHARACAAGAAQAIRCLDERAVELRGVIRGLATARGVDVDAAIGGVQRLRSVEECSGASVASEPPRVRALRLRTTEAVSALRAGAPRSAEVLLRELSGTDDATTLARLTLSAELDHIHGNHEAAAPTYEELYFLHRGRGRDQEAYGAALQLVRTYSDGLRDAERTRHWRRELESLRGQVGTDPRERADFAVSVGAARIVEGSVDEAASVLVEAFAEAERVLDDDVEVKARLANHVGWVYSEREQWADALRAYERAEALYAASTGRRHPTRAKALANIGYVLAQLDRPETVDSVFDEALASLTAAHGERHREVGLVWHQRAAAEIRLERWRAAKLSLEAALGILEIERPDDPSLRTQLDRVESKIAAE